MAAKIPSLESVESASPVVTRSVAAGLLNQPYDIYQFPAWQKSALNILGHLPQGFGRWLISRFEGFSGIGYPAVQNLSVSQLIQERLRDYHNVLGPFPSIILGSALGGATAHLSLAAGGPFLPQAFVLTLRGGSYDGNITTYFERSANLAQNLAQKNPGILTIQHFDPVHDEWMTRFVNHLRFKLLKLPKEYAAFIQENLLPGGDVLYLDCGAKWLRYRIAENSVFQIGGWGDLTPEEYIEGSSRLDRYLQQQKLKHGPWKLSGYPIEEGSESEWGSEPGLEEDLRNFCHQKGYKFIKISLPQPHDFSTLAFRTINQLIHKTGQKPAGVLIEMFSQFDTYAVIAGGLLPLWLVFNTIDSLEYLKRMLPEFPIDKPIFFSPLATFTQTPDLVPWSDWEETLRDLPWRNIGTRPSHYPADPMTVINWTTPLREWITQNHKPIIGRMTGEEILELANEI